MKLFNSKANYNKKNLTKTNYKLNYLINLVINQQNQKKL